MTYLGFWVDPSWNVRLIRVTQAIRNEDIDTDISNDSATSYLMRGLVQSPWRDDYFGSVDRSIPGRLNQMRNPVNGRSFRFQQREIEEVMMH